MTSDVISVRSGSIQESFEMSNSSRGASIGAVVILAFSVLSSSAKAGDWEFSEYWHTPYSLFSNEGFVVSGADKVGGVLLGGIGFIVGIPVGIVAAPIGGFVDGDYESSFDFGVETTSKSFSAIGKVLVATPVIS